MDDVKQTKYTEQVTKGTTHPPPKIVNVIALILLKLFTYII